MKVAIVPFVLTFLILIVFFPNASYGYLEGRIYHCTSNVEKEIALLKDANESLQQSLDDRSIKFGPESAKSSLKAWFENKSFWTQVWGLTKECLESQGIGTSEYTTLHFGEVTALEVSSEIDFVWEKNWVYHYREDRFQTCDKSNSVHYLSIGEQKKRYKGLVDNFEFNSKWYINTVKDYFEPTPKFIAAHFMINGVDEIRSTGYWADCLSKEGIDVKEIAKLNDKIIEIFSLKETMLKEDFPRFYELVYLKQVAVGEQYIPNWIRNNAQWWSEGSIGDEDFVSGIQHLIKEGIIQIPETVQSVTEGSEEIPSWIRNNAEWWANGLISDDDFVKGIQFLVEHGIIKV